MPRSTLLVAARSGAVRAAVEASPFGALADRFVAGTTVESQLRRTEGDLRRLVERPANLAFFARSLLTRG